MGICRGVPSILEDLQLVKPTTLFSVPTLYKKVFDGVHNLMESASPIRKSLMRNALALGDLDAQHRNGLRGPLGPIDSLKFSILNKVVLSKIRDRFGGNMTHGFVADSTPYRNLPGAQNDRSWHFEMGFSLAASVKSVSSPSVSSFHENEAAIPDVFICECVDCNKKKNE